MLKIPPGFTITLLILAVGLAGGCQNSDKKTTTSEKLKPEFSHKSGSEKDEGLGALLAKLENKEPRKLKKPRSYAEALRLARGAIDDDYWMEAVKYTELAMQFNQQHPEAYRLRGRARFHSGLFDNDEVLADYKKALSLGSLKARDYENIADIANERGEKDKALINITKAISLEPDNKYLYQNRAQLYSALNQRGKALKDLATYIKLRPEHIHGYILRGQYLESYGHPEKALADFTKAAQIAKRNKEMAYPEILKHKASILKSLGRRNQAIEVLTTVVKIGFKDDDDALRQRGDLYAELGKYKLALADYNQAIKLSPGYARASYESRARTLRKLNRLEEAEADEARARELADKRAEKPVFELKKK